MNLVLNRAKVSTDVRKPIFCGDMYLNALLFKELRK